MKNETLQKIRSVHGISGMILLLPAAVIILSGIYLQIQDAISLVSQPDVESVGNTPLLSFGHALSISRSIRGAQIRGLQDIRHIQLVPDKGIIKVETKNHWQIQIDQYTGKVLRAGRQYSDVFISIHDGSFFHSVIKYIIFFPTGIGLFGLLISGAVLAIQSRRTSGVSNSE